MDKTNVNETNELTAKMLKPLSMIKLYRETFSVPVAISYLGESVETTETKFVFPCNKVADIFWKEDIGKFLVSASDYDGYANLDLICNIKCELDRDFNTDLKNDPYAYFICKDDTEIIRALENIRLGIKLSELESGDMFTAYSETKKDWIMHMIAGNTDEYNDYVVVNLSTGSFWSVENEYCKTDLKWVLLKSRKMHMQINEIND